jgi:hypothetical protein
MHPFTQSEATLSPDLNALVTEFTERLAKAADLATVEIGTRIIDDIFARVAGRAGSAREKRAWKRAQRERGRIIGALTKQLLAGIENCARARVREILAQRRQEIAASAAAERRAARAARTALRGAAVKPRRRRQPVRPGPPPLDPEQIQRDAEFARLRAILKPVTEEPIPALAAAVPLPPPREVARPTTPGEALRALEKEIQDAVPTLGRLGPERCAAQIAIWGGQVRELRDRLPPDVAAAMRPAFRIFLEHLTQLHAAMEVEVVDALEPTFIAPDWEIYIEANRAVLEQRPPTLSDDKLQVHHRTMLRALILPHRRNANREAIAIIEAALRGLPPDDPQLQSALRRFASLWKSRLGPAAEAPVPENQAEPSASPPSEHQGEKAEKAAAEPVAEAPVPSEPSTPGENEFDSPWLK